MPEHNREEIAKLEALYESNPEGRVFTHLAEAYRKAGEYERARSILEKGLEKHPSYASAHVVLGRVFADLNDIPQARASFRHVLDLDPHNLVALRSLGELARAAGNNEEALGYFEELRHQDPGNDEVDRIIDTLKQAPVVAPAETPQEATAEAAPAEDAQVQGTFEEPSFAGDSSAEAASASADVLEELPGFEAAQPDYGDLVSGDIDLGWTAGAETDAAVLPGDLGDLVSEAAASAEPDSEPAEEAAPEFEAFDVSDLEYVEEEVTYEVLESVELPPPEPPLWEQVQEPEAEELLHSVFSEPEPAAEAGDAPPDDLATETMAELLVDQGLHQAAADVYRALIRERPWDPDLKNRLAEVEALGRASESRSLKAEPEQPFQTTPVEVAEPEAEPELESPWMSAPASAPSAAATPYAWTDEVGGAGDEERGPPITDYFRALLSWQPGEARAAAVAPTTLEPEPEPEGANFEPTPETADQPAVVALETSASDEAAAVDQLMPWEVPELPEQATLPTPTARRSDNPVDAAFEEWFNASEPENAEQTPASAPVQEGEGDGEGEDDDDLEMFRSWLQSLKK
jgi:tetratricopeptide (TPR) repeat protein